MNQPGPAILRERANTSRLCAAVLLLFGDGFTTALHVCNEKSPHAVFSDLLYLRRVHSSIGYTVFALLKR